MRGVAYRVCSVQLEKERQQREDAEKEKRELEDRLKKYEDEFEKAKLGEFRLFSFVGCGWPGLKSDPSSIMIKVGGSG